jgi:hypothetical protein
MPAWILIPLLITMSVLIVILTWKVWLRLVLIVVGIAEIFFRICDRLIIMLEDALGLLFVYSGTAFEYYTSRDVAVGGYWSPLKRLSAGARKKWPRYYD